MRPDHGPSRCARLLEVGEVSEFFEDTEIQEGAAIIHANLSVGERDLKLVVVPGDNSVHSGMHDSPQRVDLERLLTAHRKLPVREKLILVDLDPRQDESHFPGRNGPIEHLAI